MQNWCGSNGAFGGGGTSSAGSTFSALFPSAEEEETLREKKKKLSDLVGQMRELLGSDCRASLVSDFQKRVVHELESNLVPSKAMSPFKSGIAERESFSDAATEDEGAAVAESRSDRPRALRPSRRTVRASSKESAKESQDLLPITSSSKPEETLEITPKVETPLAPSSPVVALSRSDSKTDMQTKKKGRPLKGKAAALAKEVGSTASEGTSKMYVE